jgi:hypothetical protein
VTPVSLDARLRDELLANEQLIWSGHPVLVPHIFVTTRLFPPFAVLWVVVSAGRLVSVIRGWRRDEIGFEVVAVASVLLALGLWLLVGPVLMQWLRARRSGYALTDRRVLVLDRPASGRASVTSHSLDELGAPWLTTRRDGSGTIRFGVSDLSFDDIPEADRVFDLIRERADAVR